MFLKKGFSLIELMIVVTIIAILTGAALPYVQDYVDESRRAKTKNDLDEIRNALALYELRRLTPYTQTNIASLVGPFLSKPVNDGWGVINPSSSTVYSLGPDGKDGTGDEIKVEFRPRMAVSKIYWYDTNMDGKTVTEDALHIYLTRPLSYTTADTINGTGLKFSATGLDLASPGQVLANYGQVASFPVPAVFTPGSDTITIDEAANYLTDLSSVTATYRAKGDVLKILAP